MLDDQTPYSDAWWLKRLLAKMNARPKPPTARLGDSRRFSMTRSDWLDLLWNIRTGEAPLNIPEKWAEATREFIRLSKTAFGGLVVEALLDRVQWQGIRAVGAGDADGDDFFRGFLNANGSFIQDAEDYALTMGEGYVLVGPPDAGESYAIATAEDPRSLVVETDPAQPRKVLAALKVYWDGMNGRHVAALYLRADANGRDRVRVYVRPSAAPLASLTFAARMWNLDEDRSHDLAVQGLGVPVVPITNRRGVGEFEHCIDLLARISDGIGDRLWAAKYQAFRQRAIETQKDNPLPDLDAAGQPIDYDEVFAADPGALWEIPAGAKIWESSTFDIQSFLLPLRDDIKELSAVTRTPLAVFTPDAMSGSAEGATLAREGISFKADDRILRWSPDIVHIARLARAYSGKDYAGEWEAISAPVERLSLSQRMSAGRDARTAGVPLEGVWADVMQTSPATVANWRRWRDEEQLYVDTPTPKA